MLIFGDSMAGFLGCFEGWMMAGFWGLVCVNGCCLGILHALIEWIGESFACWFSLWNFLPWLNSIVVCFGLDY
jgi:hypothetical protein